MREPKEKGLRKKKNPVEAEILRRMKANGSTFLRGFGIDDHELWKLSAKQISFIRGYMQTCSYKQAYLMSDYTGNPEQAEAQGYLIVNNNQTMKSICEKIKAAVMDHYTDAFFLKRFERIWDDNYDKKDVLETEKSTPGGLIVERKQVDRTPYALDAMGKMIRIKQKIEQSINNNVQVNVQYQPDF